MTKNIFALLLCLLLLVRAAPSKAEPMKEFIMACTYGVMAGTLVGTATLAFTKKPGDNLRNIARGASLGLYSGIALGLYVVYVVPGQEMDKYEKSSEDPGFVGLNSNHLQQVSMPVIQPKWLLQPSFGEQGLDGMHLQITALSW